MLSKRSKDGADGFCTVTDHSHRECFIRCLHHSPVSTVYIPCSTPPPQRFRGPLVPLQNVRPSLWSSCIHNNLSVFLLFLLPYHITSSVSLYSSMDSCTSGIPWALPLASDARTTRIACSSMSATLSSCHVTFTSIEIVFHQSYYRQEYYRPYRQRYGEPDVENPQ